MWRHRLSGLLAPLVTALGEYSPGGTADVKLKLSAQQGGKQQVFDVDAQVARLSARVGKDRTAPVDVHLRTAGRGTEWKQFALSECSL